MLKLHTLQHLSFFLPTNLCINVFVIQLYNLNNYAIFSKTAFSTTFELIFYKPFYAFYPTISYIINISSLILILLFKFWFYFIRVFFFSRNLPYLNDNVNIVENLIWRDCCMVNYENPIPFFMWTLIYSFTAPMIR